MNVEGQKCVFPAFRKNSEKTRETPMVAAPEIQAVKSKVGRFHGKVSSVIKGRRTELGALNYHLLNSEMRAWISKGLGSL